jgi:hypothetical protein
MDEAGQRRIAPERKLALAGSGAPERKGRDRPRHPAMKQNERADKCRQIAL